MSSRLFESLAAGAVVICDENPFARRFFGDRLLYIDTTTDVEKTCEQVQAHLKWIRSEPKRASKLAAEAQSLFLEKFSLDHCLKEIYRALPQRKEKLARLYQPKRAQERISTIFLMPEWQPDVLARHAQSLRAQRDVSVRPVLAIDSCQFARFAGQIQKALAAFPVPVCLQTLDFYDPRLGNKAKGRRRTGRIIHAVIEQSAGEDYFCIVAPHESLFSNHLCSLLHALQECSTAGAAWADMLVTDRKEGEDQANVIDDPDPGYPRFDQPTGFGRFLFRKAFLPPGIDSVLPYLDTLAMDLLFGLAEGVPTRRCTCVADLRHPSYCPPAAARPEQERELLMDYAPSVFRKQRGGAAECDVDSMSAEQREAGGRVGAQRALSDANCEPRFRGISVLAKAAQRSRERNFDGVEVAQSEFE